MAEAVWEEYREIVLATSDLVRKVKAQIELDLSRATKKASTGTSTIKGKLGKMWAFSRRKPGYLGYGED